MKDFFNQIEDYLEGNLSKEDLVLFEKQLLVDPKLEETVKQQELALEAVDVLVQERLKTKLKFLQKERAQQSRFSIKKYLIPIAASLLLVTFLGLYWGMSNSYSDQALVASNFQPYDASSIRGSQTASPLDNGLKAYTAKDYSQAYAVLNEISDSDPTKIEATFLAGNAALKIKNNKEAIALFAKVIASDDPRFMEGAQWYQGLAFLQNNQSDLAKKTLQTLATDKEHAYSKKAVQLLADMDSFWR